MSVTPKESGSKIVFVTVGTTQFDELITQVLHPNTLEILEDEGFCTMIVQIGRGVEPPIPISRRIQISCYHFKENISFDMEAASLIISHAGAGSCLEALSVAKPLIVVVNQKLMGNHQLELAEKLHSEGHVFMCYPETLKTTIVDFRSTKLHKFPRNNPLAFSAYLEKLMGFQK
ncbi:hypothetical protein DAPPUDRAFT_308239 [Daphnia pulex]|uniref:UDP-N-acetylglucosamine transferase subunit ALG13 n=1 Tax=Daphnia pulex TaxID=6669 RepID=E9H729_DAPPU|nr:hypothetical protein DAPPUDRAFT_308239 [Daphnia pulex]CAG4640548.1 EOG090X0KOU [Daphnia pulex]|eukprot:EFX72445.1 hypothetical protein DAPPUDRAFT_308239 [Daphnia pulex]